MGKLPHSFLLLKPNAVLQLGSSLAKVRANDVWRGRWGVVVMVKEKEKVAEEKWDKMNKVG